MACWIEQGDAAVQAIPDPVGDASKICRLLLGGVPGRVGGVGLIDPRATYWSPMLWQCPVGSRNTVDPSVEQPRVFMLKVLFIENRSVGVGGLPNRPEYTIGVVAPARLRTILFINTNGPRS